MHRSIFALSLLALSGCAQANLLVGTWSDEGQSSSSSTAMTFGGDGAFTMTISGRGTCSGALTWSGRYTATFSTPTSGFWSTLGTTLCGGALRCPSSGGSRETSCAAYPSPDGQTVSFTVSEDGRTLRLPGQPVLTRAR